jgi:conserved hypothetical protein
MQKSTYFWLSLLGVLYFALFIVGESKYPVANILAQVSSIIPLLVIMTITSWMIRYYRWYYLLEKESKRKNFISGILPYIAGFAFTATPGKLGELVRVRYFSHVGHKPQNVVSVFIIERTSDLLAVLLLSCTALIHSHLFFLAIGFVSVIILFLAFAYTYERQCKLIPYYLYRKNIKRFARALMILIKGIVNSRLFLRPRDIMFSLCIGLVAWGLLSYTFIILLSCIDIDIPISKAISIYPLSMLAGAASMLPGGMGSTESAITYLLMQHQVTAHLAIMVAIIIRIITLWMAIFLGIISMMICEKRKP